MFFIPPSRRLEEMSDYYFARKMTEIRAMERNGTQVLNLGIGSPDLQPSQETIQSAVRHIYKETNHGYGSARSLIELRKEIADWYMNIYGIKLSAKSEILPLMGSKMGITLISLAYLNPGDKVLVPDPGYPTYRSGAHMACAQIVTYSLTEDNEWYPSLTEFEKMDLNGIRLLWVNYPNMPTGQEADHARLMDIVAICHEKNIVVCNDNPYSLTLSRQPSSILEYRDRYPNVIELNSMSKSFNMAGWRLGILAGDAGIIDAVLKIKSNIDSGIFIPIQKAAITALRNSEAWHKQRNDTYRERREVAYRILDKLGFSYTRNQAGMFVWAKAPDSVPSVEAFIDQLFHEKHIFITPGTIFGKNGERYIRIALTRDAELLEHALRKL